MSITSELGKKVKHKRTVTVEERLDRTASLVNKKIQLVYKHAKPRLNFTRATYGRDEPIRMHAPLTRL